MKKQTKLSIQWFYTLLERGECDIMDFKEQLEDKTVFNLIWSRLIRLQNSLTLT